MAYPGAEGWTAFIFRSSKSTCSIGVSIGFLGDSVVKNPPTNAGDLGSVPGLERSRGEGKGYPLQYSSLENSMDCISPWGHQELDTTE